MEPRETLERYGLARNESAVYLALLQLGQSAVLPIARRTSLKRPTVYLILDELIRKGFVALVPQEKKKLYLALPPERLREDIERRLGLIASALPELSALYRSQTAKPAVQFFESKEGILNLYREITNPSKNDTRAREVLSFFSLGAIPKEFEEVYNLFIEALKMGKISARELIYAKDKSHFYIQKTARLPNHATRLVSAERRFATDNAIYGNKIAVFSFRKRFAITIGNEDVATSFRSLFELAWQSAEER